MALKDNMQSYWRCEESSGNLLDAHGSSTGIDNATVGSATGKVDGGRDFEVTNVEYFNIAHTSSLSVGNVDFSIALWYKPESVPTSPDSTALFFKNNFAFSAFYEYLLLISDFGGGFHAPVFLVGSGTAYQLTDIDVGNWYFIVAWHDSVNDLLGVSVNGATPTTFAFTHPGTTNTEDIVIGPSDGVMDEIAFWKRKLSDSEISELYNSGNGRNYAYVRGFHSSYARNANQVIAL